MPEPLPPLARVMDLVRDLRVRCDWDRAQTRQTLRPYLVEEVLELDHAIAQGDREAIVDETGDVMLHLAWQLVLNEEEGLPAADQCADRVVEKMRRRHPHLFELGPREDWERVKRPERSEGLLEGLPPRLPPLLAAYRMQQRAAAVDFDWPDASGALAKVREETAEAADALASGTGVEEEIGDLLFAVVNLARKAGVHPVEALEGANRKFAARFGMVERLAAERGLDLHRAGLAALDALWEEAKRGPAAGEPAQG